MFRNWLAGWLVLIAFVTQGQQVAVHGSFERDSVKLGQPIRYFLSATYPSNYQLLFPDSTFSFAPFEFVRKDYTTTHTVLETSTDSVVYTLTTYEIDSIQSLALPVFQVQRRDCLVYQTLADTVFFVNLVPDLPDSLAANQLPLKTNTAYNPVSWLLNYPVLLIAIGVLLVLVIAGWIIFGKRIRKYFAVKRLTKNHQEFILQFEKSIEGLQQKFSSHSAEKTMAIWKLYMERLSEIPYTKFTTQEVRLVHPNNPVNLALAEVDRMVYGNLQPASFDAFTHLRAEAEDRYAKRVELIKRNQPTSNL